MLESLSHGTLIERIKELAGDTSPAAQAERHDLVEQLVTLDIEMQQGRRRMCGFRSEQNAGSESEVE